MVYQARTPEQQAAVDWAEVERRIDAGITKAGLEFDFAPNAVQEAVRIAAKRVGGRVWRRGRGCGTTS